MVLSKKQQKKVLIYILEEVLGEDPNSDVHQALRFNGINSLSALCELEPFQIWTMTYPEKGSLEMLKRGATGHLQAFKAFVAHQATIGKEIMDHEWMSISMDAYDQYRISQDYATYQQSLPSHQKWHVPLKQCKTSLM